MKSKSQIAILLSFAMCQISFAWEIEKHVDEITDVKQYIIWTTGTVVKIDSVIDYTPQLQIRLISPIYNRTTDALVAKFELMFAIETEGLRRSGAEVLYRIDAEKPVHEIWTPTTTRRGAFSPHPHDLYLALKGAKTFSIRYITTLGDIRTSKFDVSGIERATQKIKEEFRLLAPAPPPAPRDDPAVVEARKAKAARAYARQLQDIRQEIANRTREHAEEKLKPKRLTLLDLQRRNHKLGTVWIQRFNADGKTWRTGFLHSSGILSKIAPSTLQTYIDESTPE